MGARKPPQSPEQRLLRALRSMAPGSMNGRVASAAPMTVDQAQFAARARALGSPGPTLNTLPDVDPTGLADGAVPTWDATAKLWKPGSAGSALPCTQQSGTTYTLALGDAYTCVEFTATGAVTCTIPTHASQAFDVGSWIQVRQFGAGQITFAAATGVTMRSPNSAVKTCNQMATIVLHQRATDDWVLIGDLV